VKQFVPNVRFLGRFPFSIEFHDAASGTPDPRDVFGNRGEGGAGANARFAHAVAKEGRVCTADQTKISTQSTAHALTVVWSMGGAFNVSVGVRGSCPFFSVVVEAVQGGFHGIKPVG